MIIGVNVGHLAVASDFARNVRAETRTHQALHGVYRRPSQGIAVSSLLGSHWFHSVPHPPTEGPIRSPMHVRNILKGPLYHARYPHVICLVPIEAVYSKLVSNQSTGTKVT